MSQPSHPVDTDTDIVALWVKRDPIRWTAGVLGGLFAGIVMLVVSGLLCAANGLDVLLPVKMAALPILGGAATEFAAGMPTLITGFAMHELMCAFLGFVYAQFTGGNSKRLLFGVGITWAAFGWVFITCLFTPSWRDVLVLEFPKGIAFAGWMSYGVSLMSVGFFDRLLRKSK